MVSEFCGNDIMLGVNAGLRGRFSAFVIEFKNTSIPLSKSKLGRPDAT